MLKMRDVLDLDLEFQSDREAINNAWCDDKLEGFR